MNDANKAHLGRHVVARVVQISKALEWAQSVEGALNEADKTRVRRFRIPEDRLRFLAGRALLRSCLQECGESPALLLELSFTPRGRPIFISRSDLQFSLSHAGDYAGITLTLKTLVGIDLEALNRRIHFRDVAERIFSPEDLRRFDELPAEENPNAFFRAWTAKEAYLKAKGEGISAGMEKVMVPFSATDFSGALAFKPGGENEGTWCLQSLPLPPKYLGHAVWNDPQKCLDFRVLNPTSG